jgi:nucleotide-binding universal stress UspA family protein
MRTIVSGYDGSDESKDALRLASDMSKATGAQLVVVCVEEIEPYWGDLNLDQLNEERTHYFERMFTEAADQVGATFARVTGVGSAPPALEQAAEERHADAIVVGSSHRAGMSMVLPGSTADRLLSGASCPVVIAPRGYVREPGRPIQHIGVAYDGQRESDLALDAAIEMTLLLGGDLRLIAVNEKPLVEPLDRYFREHIEEGVKKIPEGIGSSSVVRVGSPAEELAKEGARLDLMVIGSRGYGPIRRVLLGGTAHKLLAVATSPVMVVPRSSEKASKRADTHEIASVVI